MMLRETKTVNIAEKINHIWANELYPGTWRSLNYSNMNVSINKYGAITEFPDLVTDNILFSITNELPLTNVMKFSNGYYSRRNAGDTEKGKNIFSFESHSVKTLSEVLAVHDDILTSIYLRKGKDLICIWSEEAGFFENESVNIDNIDDYIQSK